MANKETPLIFKIPSEKEGGPTRFSLRTSAEELGMPLHPFEKQVLNQLMKVFGSKKNRVPTGKKECLSGYGLALYGINSPSTNQSVSAEDMEKALIVGTTINKTSRKNILKDIPESMLDKGRTTRKRVLTKTSVITGPFLTLAGVKVVCALLFAVKKSLVESNMSLFTALASHAASIGVNKLAVWDELQASSTGAWKVASNYNPSYIFSVEKGVLHCSFTPVMNRDMFGLLETTHKNTVEKPGNNQEPQPPKPQRQPKQRPVFEALPGHKIEEDVPAAPVVKEPPQVLDSLQSQQPERTQNTPNTPEEKDKVPTFGHFDQDPIEKPSSRPIRPVFNFDFDDEDGQSTDSDEDGAPKNNESSDEQERLRNLFGDTFADQFVE